MRCSYATSLVHQCDFFFSFDSRGKPRKSRQKLGHVPPALAKSHKKEQDRKLDPRSSLTTIVTPVLTVPVLLWSECLNLATGQTICTACTNHGNSRAGHIAYLDSHHTGASRSQISFIRHVLSRSTSPCELVLWSVDEMHSPGHKMHPSC